MFILLASYPKSGNTLVRALLSSYFSHMFRYQCSDKAGYLSWGYTVYKYKEPLTNEQQHQLNLDTIPTIVI